MSVILSSEGFHENSKYISINNIFTIWSKNLEKIDTDVRLRDLLFIVEQLTEDKLQTLEKLTQSNIKPFLGEFKRSSQSPIIKVIRINKHVQIRNYENDSSFRLLVECDGIGDDDEYYYIEFIPLYDLKQAAFCMDTSIKIYSYKEPFKEVLVGEYDCTFTVGEFITAIFQEFFFFKSPEERNSELHKMGRENSLIRRIEILRRI